MSTRSCLSKAGLSNKDIKDILSGELEGVPEDEALAVLLLKTMLLIKKQ